MRWTTVSIAPAYEVSDAGKVRRKGASAVLRDRIRRDGYNRAVLSVNGARVDVLVHRLVVTAFVPNPANKPHTNHIDNVRTNNRASNLEWVTRRENMQHMARQDRQRTKKRPVIRISPAGAEKFYSSTRSVAADGFKQPAVCQCALGRIEWYRGYKWRYATPSEIKLYTEKVK